MVQRTAVDDNITTLAQLEQQFNLSETDDEYFFTEWFEDLPGITHLEKQFLDKVKNRYLDHRKAGHLGEGAIGLVMLSPLLELADFCDSPFKMRSETTAQIVVEESHDIYRARIDVWALQEEFWVVVVESEHVSFNSDVAILQALTHMISNPNPNRPAFGMVTNGSNFTFLKLVQGKVPQYAISDEFSLYRRHNELYQVVGVLKRIGEAIAQK